MKKIIKTETIIDMDTNKIVSDNKIEKTVYYYSELISEDTKKKAKEEMLHCKVNDEFYNYDFQDFLNDNINQIFPNSNIKYQYSLCYCQGDGFNLYGELNLWDIWDKIKNKFNDKEIKFIEWTLSHIDCTYKLEENRRYDYCICDNQNVLEDITSYMELNCYRNIKYDIIEKFEKLTSKYLYELCKEYEKMGYKELYELSDTNIEDYECNGLVFNEDGTIYGNINI